MSFGSEIISVIENYCPIGWNEFFIGCYSHISNICENMEDEPSNYGPDPSEVFQIFREMEPNDIKVVILVEGCYVGNIKNCGKSKHTGIALHQRDEDNKLSMHNTNIFQTLKGQYKNNFIPPKRGDFRGWLSSGVFLINTSLTFSQGIGEHFHCEKWKPFLKYFFKFIDSSIPVIFLGKEENFNLTLNRFKNLSERCYYGGNPLNKIKWKAFKDVNDLLMENGDEAINWSRI